MGLSNSNILEKVNLQYCKQLLGVKRQTPNNFIYGELGRVSIRTYTVQHAVKYWLKVIKLRPEKYVKCIYLQLCKNINENPNVTNWALSICNLLQHLGLYYAWLYQSVGDETCFIKLLKTRLTDTFIQNWMSHLSESSKAKTYIYYSSFSLQCYLICINNDSHRKKLCRLRE